MNPMEEPLRMEGRFISQEDHDTLTEALRSDLGSPGKLKYRYCTICILPRNCYNGWCGQCLREFRAINGRWPCQKS